MTLFCLVENGRIVDGPRDLPRAWRNVSGLKAETAAEHGWLPVEEGVRPVFDARSQALGQALTIATGKIETVYVVRPATAEEIDAATPRAPQVIRELAAALERTPVEIFEMLRKL